MYLKESKKYASRHLGGLDGCKEYGRLRADAERTQRLIESASSMGARELYKSRLGGLNAKMSQIEADYAERANTPSRDALIASALPMVVSIASNAVRMGVAGGCTIMDLIQAGNLGLVEAADKYSCAVFSGDAPKFSTYAYYAINKQVKAEQFKSTSPFSMPKEARYVSVHYMPDFKADTPHAFSKYDADADKGVCDYSSFNDDEAVFGKHSDFSEFKMDCETYISNIKKIFSILEEEERRLVALIYGIGEGASPLSLRDASKVLNMSHTMVGIRLNKVIEKLRASRMAGAAKAAAFICMESGIGLSFVTESIVK